MNTTYTYKEYNIMMRINEDLDEFISKVETPEADEIRNVYDKQQEILNKYDLSDKEMDNIRKGLEDTIKTKFGLSESFEF